MWLSSEQFQPKMGIDPKRQLSPNDLVCHQKTLNSILSLLPCQPILHLLVQALRLSWETSHGACDIYMSHTNPPALRRSSQVSPAASSLLRLQISLTSRLASLMPTSHLVDSQFSSAQTLQCWATATNVDINADRRQLADCWGQLSQSIKKTLDSRFGLVTKTSIAVHLWIVGFDWIWFYEQWRQERIYNPHNALSSYGGSVPESVKLTTVPFFTPFRGDRIS